MSGRQQHICFYSNKCKWSKAFLDELKLTPWFNDFRLFCVDKTPDRPPLPSWLKSVPTLVIAGEQQPRTDAEVMNWLYEKKMREGVGQRAAGSGHQSGAPAGMGGEPDAWNVMEHGAGVDVHYSNLNADTSAQGNGGYTNPGAFAFLHGAAAPGDRTGAAHEGGFGQGTKKSKKEELFDKQMEAYQRERNAGMPQGPNRI